MKVQWFAFVLVLSTALLRSQQTTQSAASGLIEGEVVSATTGERLRKTHVGLRLEGSAENAGTTTDAVGRFAIAVVNPGKYRLYAERNGYLHGEYGSRSPEKAGTTLLITSGQHIQDISIRLVPQSVISGRVVDEGGEPFMNVDVEALHLSYSRGTQQMVPVWTGTTNDAGEFRAYGLNPGRYLIAATYRGNRSAAAKGLSKNDDSGLEAAYPLTYFPGPRDPRAASPIEVAAGSQIRNIELALLPMPSVYVRGRVINPVLNSAGRTTIVLIPRDGAAGYLSSRAATIKDGEGTFEIEGVTPGSYALLATWSGGSRRFMARQNLEVGAVNVADINLAINTGGDVAGHVRFEEGNTGPDGIDIWLEPREPSGSVLRSKVKPGGVFVIQNVAPGLYDLNVSGGPEGYYVKSARIGREDVLEKGFNLEQGAISGELEILLSGRGGQIDGVVSNDNQSGSSATIVVVPKGARRSQPYLYKTTTTDQYGRFTLRGVSPGDYRIFAWEDIESGACQDPEFLSHFEAKGEPVTIAEGAHQSVQLKLIPAEQVR